MPAYDYLCEAGHHYEKREPFGSPPQQPCEECGQLARRQFSAPTVVFKGTGWYKTDSRGKAQPPEESSAASETKKEAAAAKKDGASKSSSSDSQSSSGSTSSTSKSSTD